VLCSALWKRCSAAIVFMESNLLEGLFTLFRLVRGRMVVCVVGYRLLMTFWRSSSVAKSSR
jgi:hypothetical protein